MSWCVLHSRAPEVFLPFCFTLSHWFIDKMNDHVHTELKWSLWCFDFLGYLFNQKGLLWTLISPGSHCESPESDVLQSTCFLHSRKLAFARVLWVFLPFACSTVWIHLKVIQTLSRETVMHKTMWNSKCRLKSKVSVDYP